MIKDMLNDQGWDSQRSKSQLVIKCPFFSNEFTWAMHAYYAFRDRHWQAAMAGTVIPHPQAENKTQVCEYILWLPLLFVLDYGIL